MASLTQSVSMVTVIKFPQRCMYCLSFPVIVLKLCLSSLSFIGTHVPIPSPFLSCFGLQHLYHIRCVLPSSLCGHSSVLFYVFLPLVEWKLFEGRVFGLFHS